MGEILIIIVTFNPNVEGFSLNLNILQKSSCKIVIIDNGSKNIDEIEKVIRNCTYYYLIDLVKLNQNKGIGFAQNKAISMFLNFDYYIFFDQDSNMSGKNIQKLLYMYQKIRNQDRKVIAVGPRQNSERLLGDFKRVPKLISSGMLIPRNSFLKVGYFKDEFFIDFIDYEWCWRAAKRGFNLYKVNVTYNHETDGVNRKWGHTIDSVNRLFYIYRNASFILFNEDISKMEKIKVVFRLSCKLVFQIFLKNPILRLKTCMSGIWKGINGELSLVDR